MRAVASKENVELILGGAKLVKEQPSAKKTEDNTSFVQYYMK